MLEESLPTEQSEVFLTAESQPELSEESKRTEESKHSEEVWIDDKFEIFQDRLDMG